MEHSVCLSSVDRWTLSVGSNSFETIMDIKGLYLENILTVMSSNFLDYLSGMTMR